MSEQQQQHITPVLPSLPPSLPPPSLSLSSLSLSLSLSLVADDRESLLYIATLMGDCRSYSQEHGLTERGN